MKLHQLTWARSENCGQNEARCGTKVAEQPYLTDNQTTEFNNKTTHVDCMTTTSADNDEVPVCKRARKAKRCTKNIRWSTRYTRECRHTGHTTGH